jgi:hypothetical protein
MGNMKESDKWIKYVLIVVAVLMVAIMLTSCGGTEEETLTQYNVENTIELSYNNGDKEILTYDIVTYGDEPLTMSLATDEGVTCLTIKSFNKDGYRRITKIACGVRKFQRTSKIRKEIYN